MRCPDCAREIPLKPEVVVQKEPCRCGLTEEARISLYLLIAIVFMIFMMGSCTSYRSYLNSKLAKPGDSIDTNGDLIKPEKK
jgi:hypothetical protein